MNRISRYVSVSTGALSLMLASILHAENYPAIESAYINYRHQYLERDRTHADRVLLGIRLNNNFGFQGELKYKTADATGARKDVAFDNIVESGHEFLIDYRHKINDRWTMVPLVSLVADPSSLTYRIGNRINYKISDAFTIGGRYRYDAKKLDRDKVDKSAPDRAKQDQHTHRYDLYLDYNTGGKWSYGYNFAYYDTDYVRYNNKEYDYEQNLSIRYKLTSDWTPFVELGDVKVSSTESARQLRLRAGFTYRLSGNSFLKNLDEDRVKIESAYINYRHQFLEKSRMHADRVLLGIRLDNNFGFQGELKYKTAGDRRDVAFDNTVSSGHEFVVDYRYKIDSKWTMIPVVALVSDSTSITYRAGNRLNYKMSNDLTLGGRYRYDAKKLDRDKVDKSAPDRAKQNQHTHRYDFYLDYNINDRWSASYNLAYYDTDYIRYDNKKEDYEQGVSIKYKFDNRWTPFVEFGDVKVDSTTDSRQLRFRFGVNYRISD